MWPVLLKLPAWIPLLLGGAVLGATLAGGEKKRRLIGAALVGAGLGLALGAWRGWLSNGLPIHGYGTLIVAGFVTGVWMARRHAPDLGLDPDHCTDMGLWGLAAGLAGARIFHVIENWATYSPFGEEGARAFLRVFAVWEGGLVFYGAFIAAILAAFLYCRYHRIPAVPFWDLAAPALIAGHAIGRLGCLARGCCHGRVCELPWALHFPPDAPAYLDHRFHGLLPPGAAHSLAVHPTQIYAFIGMGMTALFLFLFWKHRRYDGQIVSLMFIMGGTTRFFEEFLRADTGAALPGVSQTFSISQYIGGGLVVAGFAAMMCFRARGRLYAPRPPDTAAAPQPAGS